MGRLYGWVRTLEPCVVALGKMCKTIFGLLICDSFVNNVSSVSGGVLDFYRLLSLVVVVPIVPWILTFIRHGGILILGLVFIRMPVPSSRFWPKWKLSLDQSLWENGVWQLTIVPCG